MDLAAAVVRREAEAEDLAARASAMRTLNTMMVVPKVVAKAKVIKDIVCIVGKSDNAKSCEAGIQEVVYGVVEKHVEQVMVHSMKLCTRSWRSTLSR